METDVNYQKLHLHGMWYFEQLMKTSEEGLDSIRPALEAMPRTDRSLDSAGHGAAAVSRTRPVVSRQAEAPQDHSWRVTYHRADLGA